MHQCFIKNLEVLYYEINKRLRLPGYVSFYDKIGIDNILHKHARYLRSYLRCAKYCIHIGMHPEIGDLLEFGDVHFIFAFQ